MKNLITFCSFLLFLSTSSCKVDNGYINTDKPYNEQQLINLLASDEAFLTALDFTMKNHEKLIASLSKMDQYRFSQLKKVVDKGFSEELVNEAKKTDVYDLIEDELEMAKLTSYKLSKKYYTSFNKFSKPELNQIFIKSLKKNQGKFRISTLCDDCESAGFAMGIVTGIADMIGCHIYAGGESAMQNSPSIYYENLSQCIGASSLLPPMFGALTLGVCIYCCDPNNPVHCR
ncbi:hypothetical protein [Runella sp.]|uniref:hypothetical protein n=1 Tax=Runella sp. TaxID=1960881 RepID=UPI003D112CAD